MPNLGEGEDWGKETKHYPCPGLVPDPRTNIARVGLENDRCVKINYSTEMITVKFTTREIPDKQK